ncbi:MAG TPA: DUF58 domain-containing protein, partial [Bacillota bacterium]|nr:DUF58 domain-containing protein [Bacillota bacterium]
EIIKKVRRIQLKMLHLSNDVMSGHYVSAFKGAGIEFDEVREYVPGDDIRSIDWNVTARSRKPYIKRFVEERELTVILIVDLSASQRFGTVNALKSELAAEISALLAFLAIKNNDKVGLLIFSDTCERYVPPQKGRRHVLRVIREILAYEPTGTGTNINEALTFIHKVIKQRSIVFLISDFMNVDFERSLKSLARRHDLVAVSLSDPKEKELPAIGLVELRDAETGGRMLLDTSLPQVRAAFKQRALDRATATEKLFKRNKVDLIDISTDQPYLQPLQKFFLKRERRIR